ncbi:C-_U-editing enzyme APOBEC-2a [Salmo salar]|uniref:Probable C->U-editing enzyme APOBEC-2 n=1 Tax=Salmo salar TaxID=8030 RepID=B5XDM8_SALSA|nr:C->U-editing enzyme APOBEC-2a [Salmo salar]ACI68948.1 Probable C->U-editing enzyme APOBEC-2 [Salmo salar]|eukprot:NP_001134800.1 Probable C-_U-editing enzyme APOBEC-2 [Salmo salar]
MADKKGATANSKLMVRKKERTTKTAVEIKKEVKTEMKREVKSSLVKKEEKVLVVGEKVEGNGEVPMEEGATANKDMANRAAEANEANGEYEPIELPPWEIMEGDRIDPFQFKFQFKNVEYSSGRNKTFLCYLVDKGKADDGLMRGYLEDEHSGAHAEQAFFLQTLPDYDPAVKYTVTWYMSSSPCAACAAKIAEALRARKTIKMTLFSARLFEWEEQEIQAGLNALSQAGCKLRMMKPMDFAYVWDTFVENNDLTFTPWEDCQDNYEYYHEKLADIMQ